MGCTRHVCQALGKQVWPVTENSSGPLTFESPQLRAPCADFNDLTDWCRFSGHLWFRVCECSSLEFLTLRLCNCFRSFAAAKLKNPWCAVSAQVHWVCRHRFFLTRLLRMWRASFPYRKKNEDVPIRWVNGSIERPGRWSGGKFVGPFADTREPGEKPAILMNS